MTGATINIESLRRPMTLRAIVLYAILAIALSWCIQLPAILLLGLDNSLTKAVFILVMWSPTFLALAFMTRSRAAREGVRWRLGKLGYLPIGIGVETSRPAVRQRCDRKPGALPLLQLVEFDLGVPRTLLPRRQHAAVPGEL